jgi:hypothetical protein
VSKADDGARSAGDADTGVQSHGVTRASMLRPGQQLHHLTVWHALETVNIVDGKVIAKSAKITWTLGKSAIVPVRDILHTYTDAESDTP